MNKPLENTYWVVEGKFLAGEYPGDYNEAAASSKVKTFLDSGIDCFINLTCEYEPLKPYDHIVKKLSEGQGVIHKRFSITDASTPKNRQYTAEILDFIDDQLKLNHKIYIHCWGGIGRTGTIVGCWLSRHGYKGEKALAKLKELWKENEKSTWCDSPETPDQEDYILEWNEP